MLNIWCWIYQLHPYWEVRPIPNEYSEYDRKQSDGEDPVLELWRMWSTPLLPLFPGPLWHGVVAPGRVLFTGQIERFEI